jgi:RecB family endonuclease NucS
MRLDRVVEKGDEFVIIDYKTGLKDELHKSQLKRYMKLFKNCRGIIYYAETGDIIDVV